MTLWYRPFSESIKGKEAFRLAMLVVVGLILHACSLVKPTSMDIDRIFNALTSQDLVLAKSAVQQALENSLRGQASRWKNKDTGHNGSVVPEKTFLTRDGKVCRLFRHQVSVNTHSASYQDLACRSSVGNWLLVSKASRR